MTFAVMLGCETGARVSDRDVSIVEYEQLLAMLRDEKRLTVVIDVRSPERFEAERLPMAINIPLPDITHHDPRLAQAQNIVVYSLGLGDHLSRAAAKNLIARGYSNVHEFAGGLDMWKRLGGTTVGDRVPAE